MRQEYTRHVGTKFHEDGSVRCFPGNTFISMLLQESEALKTVCSVAEMLRELNNSNCLSFLPASSYHMTVIEGVCDQVRKAERWTTLLPYNAPLIEVDELFEKIWATVTQIPPFHMTYNELIIDSVPKIGLVPANVNSAQNLQHFRDEVAEKMGIRFDDHDSYRFHISLAYQIIDSPALYNELQTVKPKIDELISKKGPFTLAPPQLMYFEDMFEFFHYRTYRTNKTYRTANTALSHRHTVNSSACPEPSRGHRGNL